MASKGKRSKPRYKVSVAMKAWDLAKAGAAITVKVRDRSGNLGTIEIGQGSLRWKASHAQSFKRIAWGQLAEKLNDL